MADEQRVFGGRWQVVDTLGRGGQGRVFKVIDTKNASSDAEQARRLKTALKAVWDVVHDQDTDEEKFGKLIDEIRAIGSAAKPRFAAVKELLQFENAVAQDEPQALERMRVEIETLKGISHPALLKVFDSNIDQRWFAIEYFPKGHLLKEPQRFKGNVMEALRAIRPIVDVVGELHRQKRVHRDIKPENIFVAKDGRLVLGDCGLAIKLDNQERLTLTYENVGTRDYQPPWTYGLRVEEVQPNFDVFGLAKVIWSMVSGRPRFPLEDFDRKKHDLRQMFPDNTDIQFLHDLFRQCIVRREEDIKIHDAAALGKELDAIIAAIRRGGQVPGENRKIRCSFCGTGEYQSTTAYHAVGHSDWGQRSRFYVCDNCGHLQMFTFGDGKVPPAWEK